MPCFKTKQELMEDNIPLEIEADCLQMIEQVELLNKDNSESYLAIITNKAELESITKQVQNASPEVDEQLSNTSWRKRIYVLDDYGNGIVIYDNLTM